MTTDADVRSPAAMTWLRWSDQVACAGLVAISLVVMGGSWLYQGGLRGRVIDIDQAPHRPISFQLDINAAEWTEWAVLPGIGEMLSKRIVESRRINGPFQSHDDLRRVSGIGPRTLNRIRPYLLPVIKPSLGT